MTGLTNPFQLKDHERFNAEARRVIHDLSQGRTSEEMLILIESLVIFGVFVHVQPQGDAIVLKTMGENITQRLAAFRSVASIGGKISS